MRKSGQRRRVPLAHVLPAVASRSGRPPTAKPAEISQVANSTSAMLPSTKRIVWALAMAVAAGLPATLLWGFTVDDALISARVASSLAHGHGYRFNADGPLVDAVTPLGWAPLLALFAAGGRVGALRAARWLGLGAWLAAAGRLGYELEALGRSARVVGLIALVSCVPLAAWSVSGMETGVVIACATFGLGEGMAARLALALAAALRPELLPYALTLTATRALLASGAMPQRARRALSNCGLVALPFAAVVALRLYWFGAAYPPSWLAKAPVLEFGVRYVLGGLVLSGPFFLLTSRAVLRTSERARAILLAIGAHSVAVTLAGGDWMPFYRLLTPILPAVILVGGELAERRPRARTAVRVVLHGLSSALLAIYLVPSARRVVAQRDELIRLATPLLAGAERVAAIDIGWVGAATNASVIDLSGVSDPSIARLPGGHTSKRLPNGLLETRRVDALVVLARSPRIEQWPALDFVYAAEARLATTMASSERFQPVGVIPLRGTTQGYVVLRRHEP